ncbi:MAG: sigma-70 family RNA polymerase sigma factor [Myxococcales bacterium]|nr:sigma-70 family RNA polymerase sigma factor [Myxococcales bacterium]
MLETRTFPRANVETVATFEWADGERTSARVMNLSEGGLLAKTRTSFEKGMSVRVLLPVGNARRPLDIAGTIVRSEEVANGFSVAIEWKRVSDVDANRIRGLVERADSMAWEATEETLPRDLAVRFVPKIRRLAWTIAKRVRMPAHLGIDDLLGAGFVALVEVYTRHPNLDFDELERVGSRRIRGAMLDELRNADPLSRRMRQRQRRVEKSRTQLETELGRVPTDSEVQSRTGLKPRAYAEAVRATSASALTVFDDGIGPDIPDTASTGPEDQISRRQDLERIRVALGALPPRLKHVLELHYGDELTLREIGNILGVTEARISQLLSAAVRKLRDSCVDEIPAVRVETRRTA